MVILRKTMLRREMIFGFEDDFQCFSNFTVFSLHSSHPSNYWMLVVFVILILTCVIYNAIIIWCMKKVEQETQNQIVFDQECVDDTFSRPTRSCPPTINKFYPYEHPRHFTVNDLKKLVEKENDANVESILDYCQGGYMPTSVGQLIGPTNRYKIIRKLGWGQYSTVWLSQDVEEPKQFNAIKIVKSDRRYRMIALEEIEMLRYIRNRNPNAFGYSNVITFYNWFPSYSYHGEHFCLAFELMGPSLFHLLIQSDFVGLEPKGVKNIIKQVLSGLVYLHETCNVLHTDIKPENILISVKESYGNNIIETVNRFNQLQVHLPKTYVTAKRWKDYAQLYGLEPSDYQNSIEITEHKLPYQYRQRANSYPARNKITERKGHKSVPMFVDPNIHIKIADLGNSCLESRTIETTIQTVQYRALEVILGASYSFPVDIWSVACIAFELCTGSYLFNPESSEFLSLAENHLALIWQLLGGIPPDIATSGTKSQNYFLPSGYFLRIDVDSMSFHTVGDILMGAYCWEKKDADLMTDFVESMINPRPSKRITASEALKHGWLQE